jgi:hypothetical protein
MMRTENRGWAVAGTLPLFAVPCLLSATRRAGVDAVEALSCELLRACTVVAAAAVLPVLPVLAGADCKRSRWRVFCLWAHRAAPSPGQPLSSAATSSILCNTLQTPAMKGPAQGKQPLPNEPGGIFPESSSLCLNLNSQGVA